MRKLRPLSWFIIFVNLLFLWSIFSGVGATADSCAGLSGDSLTSCEAGTALGTGLGIFMILVLWAVVDIILLVIFLVTNKKQRTCPVCARRVKVGVTKCSGCGHDFRINPVNN